MSNPTSKETPVLHLVRFRKEYFPVTPSDLALLRKRQVSVARIAESSIVILSKTLLKGVKFKFHTWVELYSSLLDHFKSTFPEGFDFEASENWILVRAEGDPKETQTVLQNRVALLSKYCGRYGFRIHHMTKDRKTYSLTKILFVPDRNLVPSMYFNTADSLDEPLNLKFHLSPSCRVVFTKKKSPSGIPCLKVVFEDRSGPDFTESFSRAFNFSDVTVEDCNAALNFFAELISRINK